MKPPVANMIGLILTIALTLFVLFGPSYTGGGSGEYKHMNAIEVNEARALVFLVPVGFPILGLFPALGKFPAFLMLLYGMVSGGWLYIALALVMFIPSGWHTASRTSRITSAVGISLIVGLLIASLVNWKMNFLPVHQRQGTLPATR